MASTLKNKYILENDKEKDKVIDDCIFESKINLTAS